MIEVVIAITLGWLVAKLIRKIEKIIIRRIVYWIVGIIGAYLIIAIVLALSLSLYGIANGTVAGTSGIFYLAGIIYGAFRR